MGEDGDGPCIAGLESAALAESRVPRQSGPTPRSSPAHAGAFLRYREKSGGAAQAAAQAGWHREDFFVPCANSMGVFF